MLFMHSWLGSRVLYIYLCIHGKAVDCYQSMHSRSTIYLSMYSWPRSRVLSIYLSMHSWSGSGVLSIYVYTHGQASTLYICILGHEVEYYQSGSRVLTNYLCTHGQAIECYLCINALMVRE